MTEIDSFEFVENNQRINRHISIPFMSVRDALHPQAERFPVRHDIMSSGKWEIESIITHEYPWEQLPQAIEKASKVEEALNVVIRY